MVLSVPLLAAAWCPLQFTPAAPVVSLGAHTYLRCGGPPERLLHVTPKHPVGCRAVVSQEAFPGSVVLPCESQVQVGKSGGSLGHEKSKPVFV
jgi:hypothetical protein